MKYIVTIIEKRYGNIQISAKNCEEAKQKAEEIIKVDPSRFLWDASKYQVTRVCEKPLVCSNCNAEIPLDSQFCNKCGMKIELEKEIELGEILQVELQQNSKTKTIFDKYNGYTSNKKYDTLFLKTYSFVEASKNNICEYISLYIRRIPLDHSTSENFTNLTMTDLKNRFSSEREIGGLLPDIEKYPRLKVIYERNLLGFTIEQGLIENKQNFNGDYFFETPFTFTAHNSKLNEEIAVSFKYYIVGVNYRKNR